MRYGAQWAVGACSGQIADRGQGVVGNGGWGLDVVQLVVRANGYLLCLDRRSALT
jgi:hypothetical protein